MTPKERAAMQQALEALDGLVVYDYNGEPDIGCDVAGAEAITALREALDHSGEANEMVAEQAEQERKYGELAGTHNWTPPNYTDEQWQKLDQEYQDHVAKQEPIGYLDESDLRGLSQGNAVWLHPEDQGRMVSVYAAPVRTKDLTDDEIAAALKLDLDLVTEVEFRDARAVIAADREKNK